MNNFQYHCIVYDSLGGCHNTSSPASLSIPVGINEIELINIKLYPNPVTRYITIDLPTNINNATVTIYSLLGQKQICTTTNKTQTNIDLDGLKNGVYLVEVSSDNKVGRQIFIKHQ